MKLSSFLLTFFLLLSTFITKAQVSCTNWLKLPTNNSHSLIGDLDVTGNTITVEGMFNADFSYTTLNYAADVVSKHNSSSDCNYLLRYQQAIITTTNGFFVATANCDYLPNKTYHVALVYDGATLKFYRNGHLLSQVAATGNLLQNNWITRIGDIASGAAIETARGYINEVRIWNVARSQAQIRQYMNASLPSPTTQTGLLGYYVFDNLQNKQGNSTFNATLSGSAVINNTNPNCTYVADSCGTVINTVCSNWLSTPNSGAYASIGDLDVSGNKITVEATFNRTAALNNGLYPGHLVSKHTDATNDNYSLFPNGCAVATTNGYFSTFETCPLTLNKTYHVAMVYDGVLLKYYRNGFLISSTPCSGNLINNDLETTIAQVSSSGSPLINQFLGNVNEVRIWNVARSQTEIRQFMNASLPSPTTQTGLLGYYVFDNLQNKQGNVTFNATLSGSAVINNTNPNCTYVPDSCGTVINTPCSNWLSTPNSGAYSRIGDLDVTGNQITVEAQFNSNFTSAEAGYEASVVSKHTGTSDCNYSLRVGAGEITTSDGYFAIAANCAYQKNKTYHIAMVYDGSSLKYYRNGYKLGEMPASGNLVTNNLIARIGEYAGGTVFQTLKGYINEVRIWNVARSQTEIRQYMNASLPNPTTQTGLLGYYVFDNLQNKQGNSTFNATLSGSAAINNTNPNCTYVADSCGIIINPIGSRIINDYTPITGFNFCNNILTVKNATTFKVGDTVVMMQMKGAIVDSTNTAAFGTIIDYKSAGNYEFNYVKSVSGNQIELLNKVVRTYEIPDGKVQLIRVPYYTNFTANDTLTCLPWDGEKGGVLILNAQNNVTLNAPIDVSGKGFKGGFDPFVSSSTFNCDQNDYYYPNNAILASEKGEGIADISISKSYGKGPLANGGGGGSSHNSGGGGGSNASNGGFGGYQIEVGPCSTFPFDNRGLGGKSLNYNASSNKVFLGGGGGAGHSNNPQAFLANGGNGGGIVMLIASSLISNSKLIKANGGTPNECSGLGVGCHEGMGGGGGAGSILIDIQNINPTTTIQAIGAKGADMIDFGNSKVGPGGGGSGGIVWLKQPNTPSNLFVNLTGGISGVCTGYSNDAWGATSGQAGQTLFNLQLPISSIPFKKNIDSLKIKDSLTNCTAYDFKGLAFINGINITNWQWLFGDGNTANAQNSTHNYTAGGTYIVKLIVTDMSGCTDSIQKSITVGNFNTTISPSATVCYNSSTPLIATGGISYNWSPSIGLSNTTIANPIANPQQTTLYKVSITNALGCTKIDSVLLTVNQRPVFNLTASKNNMCENDTTQLQATGGNIYNWLTTGGLSNIAIANPIASPNSTTNYQVQIVSSQCNDTALLSKTITIYPLPNLQVTKSNDITCSKLSAQLNATGATQYSWTPSTGLSNPSIANPIVTITAPTLYTVNAISTFGCNSSDTVFVKVTKIEEGKFHIPNIFTPNNDRVNDCFSIQHWGAINLIYFSVYNRWGQKVFSTTKTTDCWDGTYKGILQPSGAYVYQIKMNTFCGEVYKKGTIVLAR